MKSIIIIPNIIFKVHFFVLNVKGCFEPQNKQKTRKKFTTEDTEKKGTHREHREKIMLFKTQPTTPKLATD